MSKKISNPSATTSAENYVTPSFQHKLSVDIDEKILKLSDVKEITKLSRSAIYRGAAEGTFPKQIRLGKRSSGWLMSEVKSWLVNRIEASRLDQGAN